MEGFMDELNEIKIILAEIQKDLSFHIKRTDLLEAQLKPIYHMKIWVTYTIAFLGIVLTVRSLLW